MGCHRPRVRGVRRLHDQVLRRAHRDLVEQEHAGDVRPPGAAQPCRDAAGLSRARPPRTAAPCLDRGCACSRIVGSERVARGVAQLALWRAEPEQDGLHDLPLQIPLDELHCSEARRRVRQGFVDLAEGEVSSVAQPAAPLPWRVAFAGGAACAEGGAAPWVQYLLLRSADDALLARGLCGGRERRGLGHVSVSRLSRAPRAARSQVLRHPEPCGENR